MSVSAHDIARELHARMPGSINKAKIQKLIYYCQGWHLAHYGEPMFTERIEAWKDGPVVSTMWADEKHGRPVPQPRELAATHGDIVDYVIERYGSMSSSELIEQTHAETPWKSIADANGEVPAKPSKPITHDAMRDFFTADEQYSSSRQATQQIVVLGPISADESVRQQARALLEGRSPQSI